MPKGLDYSEDEVVRYIITKHINSLILLTSVMTLTSVAAAPGDRGTPPPSGTAAPRTGLWRAWLDSPGGELPFGLELAHEDGEWKAWLINGEERIVIPRVGFRAGELVLEIDYYDSKITARSTDEGSSLEGEWVKQGRGTSLTRMKFHARAGAERRFLPPSSAKNIGSNRSVKGRWSVDFAGSHEPSVAVFEQQSDGTVSGTFLTTTGDYRFLAGGVDGDRLRLSAFDGAHAFLFDARVLSDGSLKGDFWSRETWHETWTARRNLDAVMPDSFQLTSVIDAEALDRLAFPDMFGRLRRVNDPEFIGKVRIIEIFGTWCPNCNDATQFLVELDRKYRARGLKILGLAFELTGDARRDAVQVATYRRRHNIQYPILIAGTSDKGKASAAVRVLDRVRAYPTTIFVDGLGRIRAVHTGFSGPATGDEYKKLRADFERVIEELFAEDAG